VEEKVLTCCVFVGSTPSKCSWVATVVDPAVMDIMVAFSTGMPATVEVKLLKLEVNVLRKTGSEKYAISRFII